MFQFVHQCVDSIDVHRIEEEGSRCMQVLEATAHSPGYCVRCLRNQQVERCHALRIAACACNSPVAESVNTERILWYFLPVGMGRLNTTKVCLPVESKQVEQGFKTQRAHRRSHSRTRRCSLSRVLSWQSRRRGNLTNES